MPFHGGKKGRKQGEGHIHKEKGEKEKIKRGEPHLQNEWRKEKVISERETGSQGKMGGEAKRRRGTYTSRRGRLKNIEGHIYKERGEKEEVKRRKGTYTRK